jgi:hypothetical protein
LKSNQIYCGSSWIWMTACLWLFMET